MSGRYAENTSVSSDRSRAEIENTLRRYGADQFMYGWDQQSAVIMFQANDRRVKFVLPMPDRNAREFTVTATGRSRSQTQALESWEQACRQRWRCKQFIPIVRLSALPVMAISS